MTRETSPFRARGERPRPCPMSCGVRRAGRAQIDGYLNLVIRHSWHLRSSFASLGPKSHQPEPLEERDVRADVLVIASQQTGQLVDRCRPMASYRQQQFQALLGQDSPKLLDTLEVKSRLLRRALAASDP